jgi:type VI secretion system protein ImpL
MRNRLYLFFPVFLLVAGSWLIYWILGKGGGQSWFAACLVGAVAAGSIFIFFWRYILWRREERFVGAVMSLDEAAIDAADQGHRPEAGDLQDHWRKSVETLRRSRLRKRLGNPLYALPWYLVIGESGSGKTTAIKNSNLHSPVSDLERTAGISATRTCDWWFFEEAIILDTAGRYTIPEDHGVDEEEWERFLVLLAEYRRQEPINGVVATIAADKLLAGDRPALRAEGQSVRRRIDQLMNKTGARFPVYVLVTKMDMVYGFTDTFLGLPDEQAWQAAGYLDQDGDLRPQGVIEACFRTMRERLAAMRLERLQGNRDPSPGVLVLQNQFSRLRPGLAEYAKAIFEENPYQEKPLLRGVFFSSARQTAQPAAPFLNTPILSTQPAPAQDEDRGLFLRDLFARILPNDRHLYTPISPLVRLRWAMGSLGFIAGLVVLLILCGLVSLSFLSEMTLVTGFTREFPHPPSIKGNAAANLLRLDAMRTRILDLEKANQGWLLSLSGLRESHILESRAKRDFVSLFEEAFQMPFDDELQKAISAVGADTDDEIVGRYGAFLLARVRLLNALQKGSGRKERTLEEYGDFKRTCTPLVESQDPDLPAAIAATVPQGYFSYLAWMRNPAEIRHSAEMLQSAFVNLQRRHPDLAWVATKAVVEVPDIKPADFWEPSAGVRLGKISVPGAYTMEGQRRIQEFLKTMADASPKARPPIDSFWRQYRRDYYEAWYKFCAQFAGAIHSLEDLSPQETVLMANDNNPCWRLIQRAAAETAPTQSLTEPPAWTQLLVTLNTVIRLSQAGETKSNRGAAGKGGTPKEGTSERLLEEIKEVAPVADKEQKASVSQERLEPMARVVKEYRRDIAMIAHITATKEDALRAMSEAFSEQPGSADPRSPVHAAYFHLVSIKEQMMKEVPSKEDDTVWQLFEAPFHSLLAHGATTACSVIEERWERDVWARADSVLAESRGKLLFDKNEGLVPKFREELANPFLTGQKSNPGPRKIFEKTPFERSIAFAPQFLSFINKGETPGAAEKLPRTIARCGR